MTLRLTRPATSLLPSYLDALREGEFNAMQLGFGKAAPAEIEADPQAWLARVNDPAPFTHTLKNGQTFTITEHELLWITDGARFLGTVALRYAGDHELMNVYAGHIGMAIRPALLNRGYGPRAIKVVGEDIIARFRSRGFGHIYATCNPANRASRRLIEHFGGIREQESPDLFGEGPSLRYKIGLE